MLALQHRPPDDDDSTTYSTDDPDSRATSPRASPCSWGPSSPCRVSPSSKPLRSRVSGIPPLSGQRSLAPSVMPGRLPATPLRQLQIASPNHELHQGRISRDPERHLMVSLDILTVAAFYKLINTNVSPSELLSTKLCYAAAHSCFFSAAVLYCTVLCCTVPYCAVLFHTVMQCHAM